MSRTAWNTVLFSVLVGATGAHCSDPSSSHGSGVNVTTGLPAEKKLSSFDNEDAKAACESLFDGVRNLISESEVRRAQCVSVAINETAKVNAEKTQVTLDLGKCNNVAQQCQTNPVSYGLDEINTEDSCNKAVVNQAIMHCEASVAEYEACLSKLFEQAKQGITSTTCANAETLIRTDGKPTQPDPEHIAECMHFKEKCPEVKVDI